MVGKGKKKDNDVTYTIQVPYSAKEAEEAAKAAGWNTVEEFLENFLTTRIQRYYEKKEVTKWQ